MKSVDCSPGIPLKRTLGSITHSIGCWRRRTASSCHSQGFENHPTVRHRHAMTVDGVEQCRDAAVRAELRIQMAHELVTVHVEVDPARGASALSAAEALAVEAACLGDVPHLHGYMERSEPHAVTSAARRRCRRASIAAGALAGLAAASLARADAQAFSLSAAPLPPLAPILATVASALAARAAAARGAHPRDEGATLLQAAQCVQEYRGERHDAQRWRVDGNPQRARIVEHQPRSPGHRLRVLAQLRGHPQFRVAQ